MHKAMQRRILPRSLQISAALTIPVRIVLVQTSHPGNVGAAARAMKTMGVTDLALVAPRAFPSAEATARASGADDVLEQARVVDTLEEAVGDCGFVAATTARPRTANVSWPVADPRDCAPRLLDEARRTRVALVFGPEQSGLTNEHLARCRLLVQIPTGEAYASLNLAMAVQILCYELRIAHGGGVSVPEARLAPPATTADLESFFGHLERLLDEAGYLRPDHPKQLRLKLRRIFQRAAPDRNEINILRGMLTALDPNGPYAPK